MLSKFCFERFHITDTDKYFNNYSLQVSLIGNETVKINEKPQGNSDKLKRKKIQKVNKQIYPDEL